MSTNKQIQMVMSDMLFVTWALRPEVVRKLVDERLELDTRIDSNGETVAFVSAVCFHVTEVRSSALLLPRLSFEQVNYRAYVRVHDVPSVYFFDMKVNSRMVTAMTSFLSVPVHHEEIDITTAPGAGGLLGYKIESAGIQAEVTIGEQDVDADGEARIAPDFITARMTGYAVAGDGMFRIEVEQPGLNAVSARIRSVKAPMLEQAGLVTSDQSSRPHSALYVREALFGADTPIREW
jgi:uncharacterized protein YqjF (DUF2071 family)